MIGGLYAPTMTVSSPNCEDDFFGVWSSTSGTILLSPLNSRPPAQRGGGC